jgi:hypothetical protein
MHRWVRSLLVLALSAFFAGAVASVQASDTIAVRPMFPANNVWNVPIDTLPLDARSASYVSTIGSGSAAHADFGTVYNNAPNGIPYVVVTGSQPRVPVRFTYASESDPGPYPIPADAPIEGGPQSNGDRHVLIVDRDAGKLYELFAAYPNGDGSWSAGSGAIFDLDGNSLRPATWTSADAAGLSILPGLVRYEEVIAGEIHHALRFTAPQTRNAFIWPARHQASSQTGLNYPPMGQRFRLKASVVITGFGPRVQVILRALKKFGMFLADNGSAWFISGAPDPRWDDDELHQLSLLHGSDFEAVDESSLMVDPNSGQTNATAPVVSAPAMLSAVEYHCSAGDRYLMSADPALIAALDGGCGGDWRRTGQAIAVYAATARLADAAQTLCASHRGADASNGRVPVCDAIARRQPNRWPQNDSAPPAVALPDAVDGSCSAGSAPIFGVADQRPDANHRYTTSLATRDQMLSAGWVPAGAGALGVAMCGPLQ